MRMTMKKLTQGATRLLVLALGLGLVSTAWAAPYVMSNADGSAHRWDGKYGHYSGTIVINLSTPSTLHGTGNFPASGKAALTCISISSRGQDTNSRTDTDTSSTWMHNLDHVELVEQDGATYISSRVEILDGAVDAANKFTTTLAASDSTYSANGYSGDGTGRFTYNIYFDLVKVDVTKNLTLKTYSDATTQMQLGTAAVASTKNGTDWKAPLRVYGTYYYDADTSVSDLNAKIAASSDSEVVFVFEDGVSIDVDAAFSATIPVKIVSSGSITLTAAVQPDVSYFTNVDFSGVSGGVLRSWLTPGVVGYNFRSNSGSDTSLALVSGGTWLPASTANDASGSTTEMFADGLSTFKWSSANTYSYNSGTLINGYLDDGGSQANVALSNVPYETYDIIVYAATDTEGRQFRPVTVNGTQYTWDGNNGEAVAGNTNWGASRNLLAEYGINVLRIKNLSGPLTIKGGNNASNGRGGIAAIQIVPAGTLDSDYTLTLDGTATSWSTGTWTLNGETVSAPSEAHSVEIVASASTTLTIDTAATVANLKIKGSGDAAVTISKGTAALTTKQVTVESGILKHGADNGPLGSPASIVVKNGGAMDLANTASRCYSVTIEGQGVQKDGTYTGALYSSVVIGSGAKQLKGIALSGDATVRCDNDWGIINSGYTAATMDVGSYTLTKLGTEDFWLCNATVSGAGTIKIAEGYLTTIGNGSAMNSATMEIANGATLYLSGAGLTVNTLTCRNGSNVQVASGKNLSFTNINLEGTVSYKGPISASDQSINIPSDVTFKWVDTSWTSGDYFTGTGTLELNANSTKIEHTVGGVTFSGIVKLTNAGGNQNNIKSLNANGAMFLNRPELIVNATSVHLGDQYNNNLEHPIQVRNLSGSGQLRGQWGSGTYNYLVETVQERDTAYTGTLGCDVSGGNRYVSFSVIGDDSGEIHSLTITQSHNTGDNGGCRASTITVADDAKVVFTSAGKWGNGNIVVNEDGWLESTNATAAANITLNSGSTVVVPYVNSAVVPLGGTTVTLPAAGTVYFDMSGVNVAGGTPVTVISATTLNNGGTASFAARSGKWDFNVVGNTVTATKKVLAWDGSSWSDEDYASYTDASIAVSGTQSVPLPASLTLERLTITGASGDLTIDPNGYTLEVGDIVIPEGVTLTTSSSLTITGVVSGGGCLIVEGENQAVYSGKTWTVASVVVNGTLTLGGATSSISGTVSGAGKIVYPAGAFPTVTGLNAAGWTGIVEVPRLTTPVSIAFNNLGNTGSTVVLKGMDNVFANSIPAENGSTINPTVQIDGNFYLALDNGTTTFKCVTGSAGFYLKRYYEDTSATCHIEVLTNFTANVGALHINDEYVHLSIGTLALAAGEVPNANTKLVGVDSTWDDLTAVSSTVVTIGGEATEYKLIAKNFGTATAGLYLAPAVIKASDGALTPCESVASAFAAISSMSSEEYSAFSYVAVYETATVAYANQWRQPKVKIVGENVILTVNYDGADDYCWVAGQQDEDGVSTYVPSAKATTYTWVGAENNCWQVNYDTSWKYDSTHFANRPPQSIDNAIFDTDSTVTLDVNAAIASMTISGDVTLTATSAKMLTVGEGGIVLSTLGDSLTVDNVTLSRVPTTTAETLAVRTTGGGDDPTVYTVVSAVASVDGVGYATMAEASEALKTGYIMTLQQDYDGTVTIYPGTYLVKNGHTANSVVGATVDGDSDPGIIVTENTQGGFWQCVDQRTATWSGTGAAWSSPSCWAENFAPTAYTAVTIPATEGHATAITLSGDVTIKSLALGAGETLTLSRSGETARTFTTSEAIVLTSGQTIVIGAGVSISPAITTEDEDSYVKTTVGGSTTEYSVAAKRTVTVSVGPHSSVSGVVNGQKFVPGDVLTITASADTYYTPALTVNGDAQTSPYELTTTDADVTVSATATRDTVAITIPSVANTTVSVDYETGGAAANATAAGDITVDAGTSLTATWTAASGYKITAGASQTINPVAAAQTLTSPTVEAKGATVSGVTFNYGYDFATATVTATVSGEATDYTLTVGGANYGGTVVGTTVTFSGVATGRASAYDSVNYTITASDGGASVPVTGGSGSVKVADSDTWVFENSGTTGTAAAKGSWATAVTYNDNVAAVENNTFTANNCSTGDCVTATVNDLVYTSLSDTSDMSVIANDSQGAVALGETNVNEVTTMCFMILAKEAGNFVWKPATWGGNTPQLDTPYDIAVTFDYAAKKYSVCIDGTNLTVDGATKFDLCAEKSELKSITFNGEGTLRSIEGIESTGYMVKAANGTYYPTIAAAIAAYNNNPAIGELYVLHDGTVPVGWMIIEVGGVKYLRKAPKGSLFIAF